MKNYWVSWYGAHESIALGWPWWVVGHGLGGGEGLATVCAGIRAGSADAAMAIVREGCSGGADIRFRFVSERPARWSPYCRRFARDAAWMPEWPAG